MVSHLVERRCSECERIDDGKATSASCWYCGGRLEWFRLGPIRQTVGCVVLIEERDGNV